MNKDFVIVFPEIGKGGAERVAASIVNHLVDEGYNVIIISLGPKHDYQFLELSDQVEFFHFSRKSKFDFSAFEAIATMFTSRDITYIFCIDFFAQLYMSVLRSYKKLNFKIVVNLHITIPKKKTDYLVNFLASRFLRKVDWVVFISKNQQKYITSRFLLNSACKRTLIYNGIDTGKFSISTAEERLGFRASLLASSKEDILIIKVAGIRIEKDHETAIRALSYFHQVNAYKPKLIFVGDGDQNIKKELENLSRELELTDYIVFVGFNEAVNQYLSCADLFTLTSHSVETFSLAALEAMSCGLPAVLTNIGGANEMINEDNGSLSKASDPIDIAQKWHLALAKDFNRENIRAFVVNEFDIAKMNVNYLKLFQHIEDSLTN